MLCVMHVKNGNEQRAERFIDGLLDNRSGDKCFHLMRARRKKYGGKWQTIKEPLLPGYVFINTDMPERLYQKLRNIEKYEKEMLSSENGRWYKLLGSDDDYVSTLDNREADFIEKISNSGSRTGEILLSTIKVTENGEVKILSGPLLSVKNRIQKIDFHKRVAEVETKFCGETKRMYLGIEFENSQER